MKRLSMLCAVGCLLACNQQEKADVLCHEAEQEGGLKVSVVRECAVTKSDAGYVEVLDVEKMEKKVSVFVFDKETGVLNASRTITNTEEECSFSIPVGEKTVWAVINGPELDDVVSFRQFEAIVDDLSDSSLEDAGLTMIGSADCTVEAGKTVSPTVTVARMVSRIVLRNVACAIPQQYGKLTVDCVFLGDAFTMQTFGGDVSGKVNVSGFHDAQKTIPVGKDGVVGSCPEYLYAHVGTSVNVGSVVSVNRCLYCHPNDTPEYTDMYILATIGEKQYYYKVPLDKGLEANTTCSVDVLITNIGDPEPPMHNHDKGMIDAVITVADWQPGDVYSAEI